MRKDFHISPTLNAGPQARGWARRATDTVRTILWQQEERRDDLMDALGRAWLSLDGLSVGDAFGERFFGPLHEVRQRISRRLLPDSPWTYTDDTEMALSIVEILKEHGSINQDLLANRFANRMQFNRGYGQGAYAVLCGVKDGLNWRHLTQIGFRGMGSFGNGAAMRVAPLGAFFADQPLNIICEQARLSAEVTHAHVEGIAGAIAVAVAATLAWQKREVKGALGSSWIAAIRDATPRGYTRDAISEALDVAPMQRSSKQSRHSAMVRPSRRPIPSRCASGSSLMPRPASNRRSGIR
jgi:ADP-ribosylglycohydrolase